MTEDNRDHLEWVKKLIEDLRAANTEPISPEWDSRSSFISSQVARAASNFANLTGPEKRDVFLFLLGSIVNNND